MKIAFVVSVYLAREKKLAHLLHKMGHELILVYKALWDRHGEDYFKSKYMFTDDKVLAQIVQYLEKEVDIFHVFTEPTRLVSIVADNTNRPVLGEMKDSDFLRNGVKVEREIDAFNKADATLHPTKECMELLNEGYDFRGPTNWYWPLVPKDWYVQEEQIGKGAVYQGSMTTTQEVNDSFKKGRDFSYRDYTEVFKAFQKAGLPVTCFSMAQKRPGMKEHYDFIKFETFLPYPELLKKFGEFKVGIATWGSQSRPALKSIPNKPFEYMAGGLVPVALKGSVVGNWIEDNDIGYTMIEDVPDLSDIEEKRRNLLKVRDDWCLETQVDRVIQIYKELIRWR